MIGPASPAPAAYEEVVRFLSRGATPQQIVDFRLTAEAEARLRTILERQERGRLDEEERAELDQYAQLEHLMRLLKASARQHLPQ